MSESSDDAALLRRFEPVLRFTQGEMFFPTRVDGYLERCSLWLAGPRRGREQIAGVGEVSPDNLADFAPDSTTGTYLRFVQEPMRVADYLQWRRSADRPTFSAIGRWARVGVVSRLVDAGFDLSLSLRGVVPGGTVAVAEEQYRAMLAERPGIAYYGRVVRDGGYIACHYLYFYVMNDFRSTFFGVNDHEADWEQVIVYLTETDASADDSVELSWVAFAAHDLGGDDIRRRADDPQLELVDGAHPVVNVGAGSHASYFIPGEYSFAIRPRPVTAALAVVEAIRNFWSESLGQGRARSASATADAFAIPFTDLARADGRAVGTGTDTPWQQVMLRGDEPWVERFAGLWGLDTGDPFGGERAPAGPKFQRDGSIRQSWSDVLGFAGLDKVIPDPARLEAITERIDTLRQDRLRAEGEVTVARDALRGVELDHAATQVAASPLGEQAAARSVADAQSRLAAAVTERDRLRETESAAEDLRARVAAGVVPDPTAHIKHRHDPDPDFAAPRRLAELWAATSGALLLFLVAAILVLPTPHKLATLLAGVVGFFVIDAVTRGRGVRFLISYAVVAAVVSAAVLVVRHWQWALLLIMAAIVASIIRGNLRELGFLRSGLRAKEAQADTSAPH